MSLDMPTLTDKIARLTEAAMRALSAEIVHVIRTASIDEIASMSKTVPAKRGRPSLPVGAKKQPRRRRSEAEIKASLGQIVSLLKKTPGLRSEEIQKALKVPKKELLVPTSLGLQLGQLKKSGVRRATVYFAA